MKFTTNHPYKFESPFDAFTVAFVQFLVSTMIELANVMVLLMTPDTLSLVGNFVSLVIITEFDTYVFASMKDEPMKKIVERQFTSKALRVVHTSSI